MTSQTRATLKGYFNTNDQPTEAQFADLIDSGLNLADETNWTLGSGVDEYALVYDHDTARFVLRAPFAGLLATGATVGATSQAQAFTLGVVSPFVAPAADSTAALQLRKADGTTAVVTVDTTNARVGIGTSAPEASLDVYSASRTTIKLGGTGNNYAYADFTFYTPNTLLATKAHLWSINFRQDDYFGGGIGALNFNSNISNGAGGTTGFRAPLMLKENGDVILAGASNVISNGNVGIGTISPATRLDIDAGAMTMAEMTAPTGVANKAMLYTKDTGGGKTALCVKLGDDVEIVLATQA